jgi:ABC-type Na+ efflux pump permease subunit
MMNWRAIRAIIDKDLKVALASKAVAVPMLVVPLVIVIGLPVLVVLVPFGMQTFGAQLNSEDAREMAALLQQLPASLRRELTQYGLPQAITILLLTHLFAPLYLIVPLMVSSVIAADSFAGEKERKTLEALLYSPTSDRELLLAKLLAAWIPGVVVGLGSFALYTLIANLVAWPIVGRIFFPNTMWLLLAFWVAPAIAGLGLGTTVLVSARVNSFQEAYQTGSLVVLPIILLLVGQISGLFYLHIGFVALLGLILWLIDLALFWLSQRTFQRSALLARL